MTRDTLFAHPRTQIEDFKFDERVAAVFTDMLQRSIPNYENLIFMLRFLAERFITPGSNAYDLGCSLGASALSLAAGNRQPGCRIYAIDNSTAMVEHCRSNVLSAGLPTPVETICADIRDIDMTNASIVVVNFTLQFLPVADRDTMLHKIHSALLPGGLLVLSEKIVQEDRRSRELIIDLYHAWKKNNGYSDMEISQKRTALENVLIPETVETHKTRLLRNGFSHAEQWFQCFNFISLLAFK